MQNLTKDDIFHNRSNYDIIVRSETLFLVQTEIDRIWFSQEGYSSKVCLNDSFRGGIHLMPGMGDGNVSSIAMASFR